ncbi:hypothetical protein ACMXYV_12690 [Neptuniibacter sp. SY11_33]|uniref:hypothetical protein n=1 Tax=Neptuniibacter sp. SY11_33 TaxID=3398215 RepID=UPI0039F5268A
MKNIFLALVLVFLNPIEGFADELEKVCNEQNLNKAPDKKYYVIIHKLSVLLNKNLVSHHPLIVDAVVFNNLDYASEIDKQKKEALNSALFFAFALGREEWIIKLINAGVDMYGQEASVVPFHGAAYGNCPEALGIALDFKVDLSRKDSGGLAFTDVIMLNKSSDVLIYYIDKIATENKALMELGRVAEKYNRLDWFIEIRDKKYLGAE